MVRRGEGKNDDDSESSSPVKRRANPHAPTRSGQRDTELKRAIRWLSFTKPKIVFGFENMSSNQLPATASASRGLSLCFDRINGWNIPSKVLDDISKSRGKYDLSLQLSLSLFHFPSGTFFGSTWMGSPISISEDSSITRNLLDTEYNETIYLITRIVDPTCVGVVELVCSKVDTNKSLIVAQYGCGFSLLNLFVQPYPIDIAEGPDNVLSMSVPIYQGSPRDLILDNDVRALPSKLKEIGGSKLYFRLFSHRRLLSASRLITENQLIGRFDVVAGLIAKSVTLPESTRSVSLSCIGEEQYQLGKKSVSFVPAKPLVALPMTLHVEECYLYVPDRLAMETRMRTVLLRNSNASALTEIRIVSRTLKIGIHNGHTVIGNEWHSHTLSEDDGNDNTLVAVETSIELNGYVPHESMALVMLLEYEVGVPSSSTHTDSMALLTSTVSVRPTTRLAIGSAVYVPFDGEDLLLRNITAKDADLLGIELALSPDNCSLLSLSPLYMDEALSRGSSAGGREHVDDGKSSSDGEADNDFIVSFDLKAFHPRDGEVMHGDAVRAEGVTDLGASGPVKSIGADSPLRVRGSTAPRRAVAYPSDESDSVESDALVGGTAEVSKLILDPSYYGTVSQAQESARTPKQSGIVFSPRLHIPRDKNSLLARSLLSKVVAGADSGRDGTLLDDNDDRGLLRLARPGSASGVSRNEIASTSYSAGQQVREMSRGARTKLSRYGFQDAFTGDVSSAPPQYIAEKNMHAPSDLAVEANDSLSLHEVTLTFAGYRGDSNGVSSVPPNAVYITYQFYTCAPSRTEVMRLSPSEPGEVSVLLREESISRNEATLSIRHCIDCTLSSPTEAEEFSAYLAKATLFLDVWDADSLIFVGTCGVPLRRLMRQGELSVKSSVECDIINSDATADFSGGIASAVIYDGNCMSGVRVGSLQVVMSNIGFKGKGVHVRLDSQVRNIAEDEISRAKLGAAMDGLNWRSHGVQKAGAGAKDSRRPKNVVRARPLTESTPELADALNSYKSENIKSLTALRGGDGFHSLTYDEVVKLFKRFQGPVKGMIQYRGPLLSLLDVPTWGAGYRKLMDSYRMYASDGVNIDKDILRHVNGEGKLTAADLKEFLRSMFDKTGIKYKPEDIMIIVRRFIKDDSTSIYPTDFVEFCRDDLAKEEWAAVSKRLRRMFEKATLDGTDLEQALAEKDLTSSGYINAKDFRHVFSGLAKHMKLSSRDLDIAVKHFSDRAVKGESPRDPISLKKIMSFFGKDYSGSLSSRLRTLLSGKVQDLAAAFAGHKSLVSGLLSLDRIEELFRQFAVYDDLSHEQVKSILRSADKASKGKLSMNDICSYLGITFDATPSADSPLTAEELLRILIDKSKKNGTSIGEAFRHFDIDGDGFITPSELEDGLDKLEIFDNIPSWRSQIPSIIAKVDKTNEGILSLKAFFSFLGDADYSPNIVQKMTKIFAVAIDKGMTFDKIFNEIDQNKNGKISADELFNGLRALGTFNDVMMEDVMELVNTFDQDNDKSISSSEFISFFSDRVQAALKIHQLKKAERIVLKFKSYIARVVEKGGRVEDIFKYFDKDGNSRASVSEMSAGLRKLPNVKDMTEEELSAIVRHFDADGSGTVSLAEFKRIVGKKADERPIEVAKRSILPSESKDAEQDTGESKESKVKEKDEASMRDLFVRHMRRISEVDGSIAKLLAYLDEDEDGLISESSLLKLLRREDVFDTIPEKEIDKLLLPMLHHGKINVGSLLRFLEGKSEKENAPNNRGDGEDEEEGKFDPAAATDYDFSKDTETRALEKKLRSFGHLLAKKGVDIEKMFTDVDSIERGLVRRAEFINILSQMGLYILEKGKAMDEAAIGDGTDPDRRIQLKQIHKLKGNYMDNAERFAHKFVMEGVPGGKDSDFKDHLESMALINWYRQGQKKLLLQRILSHSLAASARIYPRFGKTLFFEHPVTNPFGHEERFLIDLKDSELKIVRNFDEWMFLRRTCSSCTGDLGPDPLESEIFDCDSDGNVMVALLPHETLHIPFSFLSQKTHSGNHVLVKPKSKVTYHDESKEDAKEDSKSDSRDKRRNSVPLEADDELPQRVAEVRVLSCTHGHVCAVLRVAICNRPFVVNRTLRFFEPENTIMKRKLKLSDSKSLNPRPGNFAAGSKYVHCVENGADDAGRVMIEWGDGGASTSLELLVRYRCGSFPETGSFYLLIYNDPYQASLYETWHVLVQTRQSVHMHSSIGGSSSLDLIVRGDRYTRRGHAYSSQVVDAVQFQPESTFQLIPNVFNKVTLKYFPKQAGMRRVQVNLVDVDSRELVSAWLVTVSASAPPVMKQYDVDVVLGADVNKKIVFKNPWSSARRFLLASSDDALMKPRVELLEVAAQGNSYLRLWFSGSGTNSRGRAGVEDVYLFLNNDDGQNEESFQFRIRYV